MKTPKPINLEDFRGGLAGRRFAALIEHHIRRQSSAEIYRGAMGTIEFLPSKARPLAESFIDRWNARAYDRQWWDTDCAVAFDAICDDGRRLLTEAGVGVDDEAVFNLFQIVVLSLAWAASEQPAMRKFMGVRLGWLRR